MIPESCINDKSYIQNHKFLINITDGKCIKNNSLYRLGETFLSKGLLQSRFQNN
ncbi:hypothetical protein PARMER_00513 [Parabacteroides merdae ATCC 43184]|nr:hypothetical protein PARMER_00513 [Parabacteroides merdae ATCC 43184]